MRRTGASKGRTMRARAIAAAYLAVPAFDMCFAAGADSVSIREALRQPQAKMFWIERKAGKVTMGDPASYYSKTTDFDELTFDVGNAKCLANVNMLGVVKTLTIYRDSYRACCNPDKGWPGVWVAKDNSSFGPYAYALVLDGKTNNLATVHWDVRTGLLDNIFPITELKDPQGRFVVRLVTFAPLSADGTLRLRGIVYGLELENLADAPLKGAVQLPKLFQGDRPKPNWAMFDPFDFEIGLGDAPQFSGSVAFDVKPGATVWVPTILYQPGETTVAEVNARGTLAWLQETWRYYRRVLGRIETPSEPWLGAFYERGVIQSLQSIAMSGSGKMAGSNWGSYPATRQIWPKDCFYSCLPFMALEPRLAQKMILWFDEFGVRQPGEVVEGGVHHSISLSVASLLLASLYYDQTGDTAFFMQHPELKRNWAAILDAIVASRQEPDVWLFPTRYISDGKLDCDWHCGSNVAVWRALQGYARLLAEVFGDAGGAKQYSDIAASVREAILKKTVIAGPFGPQFIEGVNRDGKAPRLTSDGEESETTLMPFYGFVPYDDATYRNYMRFSMSTNNAQYVAATRSIDWGKGVPATAPGYNKGLCFGGDQESLFGEAGYYTEIRRVTDTDGSVPWWPYRTPQPGDVRRSYPGKAGWFAGVHSVLFVHRFLGLTYDAPKRSLRFTPHPAIGDFAWSEFPMGQDRFSVSFRRGVAVVSNLTEHPVTVTIGATASQVVPPGRTVSAETAGRTP